MKSRNKKYIWLPILLLIYGAAMGVVFGPELIAAGKTWYLATILGIDVAVCGTLFFFLRKKQELADRRNNLNTKENGIN